MSIRYLPGSPGCPRNDPIGKKAYARWHYEQNKSDYIRRAKIKTKDTIAKVRQFIAHYLSVNPCVDCGEPDPIVLEFDHRPDEKKRFDIGASIQGGYSVQSVQHEIMKCDVRCANCHRRITYRRANRTSRVPAKTI